MTVFEKQGLFRVIDPKFGENNIYRHQAGMTVSLGPVMIATVAKQALPQIDAEVISENNYKRSLGAPIDKDGLPDHLELQKSRPANYLGISASITNAVPRALEVIGSYQSMPINLQPEYFIIGGWHAGDLPEEFLSLGKNIIVVHGEGEMTITLLLTALRNNTPLSSVPGISYWNNGSIKRNGPEFLTVPQEEMDFLPIPDFGLVRYAKLKFLPLQRNKGCSGKCRFCRVNTEPRFISPERFLEILQVVISQGKRRREFFFVDDRSEEDFEGFRQILEGIIQLREQKGIRLRIFTQNRLSLGEDPATLQLMHEAGIEMAAIGCESPIPAELKAMRKPINPKKMVEWVRAFSNHGINVHMMLIFGYPMPSHVKELVLDEKGNPMSVKKRGRHFINFMRKARPAYAQILLFTPIPGTKDWDDLESQGRIRKEIGWKFFDGTHLVYIPDEGLDPVQLQKEPVKLMRKFYAYRFLWMFEHLSLLLLSIRVAIVTLSTPLVWLSELPFTYRPEYGYEKWFRVTWQKPKRVFRNAIKYLLAQWIILDWRKYFKLSGFMGYWEQLTNKKS